MISLRLSPQRNETGKKSEQSFGRRDAAQSAWVLPSSLARAGCESEVDWRAMPEKLWHAAVAPPRLDVPNSLPVKGCALRLPERSACAPAHAGRSSARLALMDGVQVVPRLAAPGCASLRTSRLH